MTTRSGRRNGGAALLTVGLALSIGLLLVQALPAPANRIPEDDPLATDEPAPMLDELAALRSEMRGAAERLTQQAGHHPGSVPVALVQFLSARAYNGYLPEDSLLALRLGLRPGATSRGEALTRAVGEASRAGSVIGGIDPALAGAAPALGAAGTLSPALLDLRSGALGYSIVAHLDAYLTTAGADEFEAARRGALLALAAADSGLKRWPTPYPDATGWAALALTRYGALAHDDSALAVGRALVERLDLLHVPHGSDTLSNARLAARAAAALAVELQSNPAPMAYIIGRRGSAEITKFQLAALRARRPLRLISVHDRQEPELLYPPDAGGKTIVYVCSGEACAAPVRTAREMVALLESFARPDPPIRKP